LSRSRFSSPSKREANFSLKKVENAPKVDEWTDVTFVQ
jgi:hypothetical protein